MAAAPKKKAGQKTLRRPAKPAKPTRTLVTQSEYARHRRVTPECVRQWRERGRLVTEGEGRALRVDVEASDKRVARYRDPQQDSAMARRGELDAHELPEADDSLDEAKRRKAWSDARKAEVELARLQGTLVERAAANRAAADFAARLKIALENMPARSSASLAARFGADEHDVYMALDELVIDVLERQQKMVFRIKAQANQVGFDEDPDEDDADLDGDE